MFLPLVYFAEGTLVSVTQTIYLQSLKNIP